MVESFAASTTGPSTEIIFFTIMDGPADQVDDLVSCYNCR